MKQLVKANDGLQEQWYEQARQQTLETMPEFIRYLLDEYSHDAQTIVHAMVAGCLATLSAMNAHPEGDLGPSQSSQLLGLFIRKWARLDGPAKIMSWAALLDPEYEDQCMRVPEEVSLYLRSLARQVLDSKTYKNESHRIHLERIEQGEMPWGFKSTVSQPSTDREPTVSKSP
jgi:hypothetical protein